MLMTIPHRFQVRSPLAPQSLPVPARERFARPDGRPLMRRIEVAALGADHSIQDTVHVVPQTEVFDRAVSGFARGTLLKTPQGLVAIEDLLPGDVVETSEGPQPVLWIGSAAILPGAAAAGSLLDCLIRVTAEAFGIGRPAGDVVLGPGAALLHNPPQLSAASGTGHVLTPLADFIDGDSVFRVTPPSAVKVYHLMVPRHAAVRAGGLELESYHPGTGVVDSMGEAAQQLFFSLFPGVTRTRDFGPLGFPRVARDLLDSLRPM